MIPHDTSRMLATRPFACVVLLATFEWALQLTPDKVIKRFPVSGQGRRHSLQRDIKMQGP